MINERRTNSVIETRLVNFISTSRWDEFEAYMLSLSNAEFRTLGHILCENVLLRYDGERFWEIFVRLSLFRPKAFLGTCLKAAVSQYRAGKISTDSEEFRSYAAEVVRRKMNIDRDKCLTALLDCLTEAHEFSEIFNMFGVAQGEARIPYLLRCSTLHSYHSLFVNIKHKQDDHGYISKCCYALIRKGDRLSFNLASILCKYFDLNDVKGCFSLSIEPYKLNYLDMGQQAFERVLDSV